MPAAAFEISSPEDLPICVVFSKWKGLPEFFVKKQSLNKAMKTVLLLAVLCCAVSGKFFSSVVYFLV